MVDKDQILCVLYLLQLLIKKMTDHLRFNFFLEFGRIAFLIMLTYFFFLLLFFLYEFNLSWERKQTKFHSLFPQLKSCRFRRKRKLRILDKDQWVDLAVIRCEKGKTIIVYVSNDIAFPDMVTGDERGLPDHLDMGGIPLVMGEMKDLPHADRIEKNRLKISQNNSKL